MPRFDRTGPWGQGPRTGGGFGLCGAGARANDDNAPASLNTMRGGRINRGAQRQPAGWGGGFMGARRQGGQGRGRGRRCWAPGGGFYPNEVDPNQVD